VSATSTLPLLGTEVPSREEELDAALWEACSRPDFQRQLGKDPAVLIEAGVAALLRRYGVPGAAAQKEDDDG
jgi:hypothetical protein